MKIVIKIGIVLVFFSIHHGLFARNAFFGGAEPIGVEATLLLPTATISGTTTVCQNAASPVITFTGSGGTAPYTFTYTVTGVAGNQTIQTTGTNSTITLAVPTGTLGIFSYTLVSVRDATTPIVEQPVAGQTATVNIITIGISNPATLIACLTNPSQTSAQVGLVLVLPTPSSLIQTISINWGDGSGVQNIPSSNWGTSIFHTYPLGAYTVTITATTSLGCSIVKSYTAFIGSSPQAATLSLFANQATGCLPHTTQFTFGLPVSNSDGTNYRICFGDNSANCIDYIDGTPIPSSWIFSGSTAQFNYYTITHVYNATSCLNVVNLNGITYNNVFLPSVITTNPCTAPQPQAGSLISVGTPPTASFTPNPIPSICINTPFQPTNTSNFGGTIDPVTYFCSSTSPFYWTISPSTAGLWTATGLGSNNGSPNNELFWTTGSITPSITFNQPGNYIVTLFVKNSCGISSISRPICVERPLVPLFNLNSTSGCTPLAILATNTTNLTNQCSAATYLWQVTHTPLYCATSTVTIPNQTTQNASYNFTTPGTYSIRLTTTNLCGVATSAVQTVTVKKPPTATINAIPDFCGTATITPSAVVNGCAPSSSVLTYAWSFPGGTPSSSSAVSPGTIIYAATGNYTVSLTVTNECGVSTTATEAFLVSVNPTITNATLSQTICSGTQTALVNLTANPAGTTYNWTAIATSGISGFTPSGNTNTIPVQTLTTTSASAGTVTYSITPSIGLCVGTVVQYVITVNPAPTFTSQPSARTACQGAAIVPLSVSISTTAGSPLYQWYSNTVNNTTSGTLIPGATNANYTPPSAAIGTLYYYCVITLSSGGCASITSATAAVTITPIATISLQPLAIQNICAGVTLSVPLTVNFSGGTGTASYQWFSNTSNSTVGGTAIPGAVSASYTPPVFNSPGTFYYYVVLTLSGNGCGTTTSTVAAVNVSADPTISVQPIANQTLCQGTSTFTLAVTAVGGLGTFSYQWYAAPATLIPGATNSSFVPNTNIVGTTNYYCIVSQPSLGCGVTSANAQIVVVPAPTITSQPQSNFICIGGVPSPLSVAYINGTGIASYQWYNGTGLIPGATNATFTPTPITTTSYYCIITFSSGGCTSVTSNTAVITVEPLPTIAIQPLSSQNICVGGAIPPLTVSYVNGVGTPTYQWYSNSSNSTSGGTPVGTNSPNFTPPVFNSPGSFYYYVVLTFSGNGCGATTSAVAAVNVSADPTFSVQPNANQTLCQGTSTFTLSVTAIGGLGTFSYQWYAAPATLIPGATNSSFVPNTNIVGTTNYYCIVSQPSLGCGVTSANAQIVVVPAPTITSQPQSNFICIGGVPSPLSVAYINGTGIASYQWYNGTGLIPGATNATFTPTPITTTSYYCIITFSSGGCTSVTSNTAVITVEPLPTIAIQPLSSQNICVGGAIPPLTVSYVNGVGTPTYQWYSNSSNATSGGSSVGTNSPNFTPPVFNTVGTFYYYVTVSLSGNGCGNAVSNSAQIIVVADPTVSTQPLTTQTICQGTTPTTLSVTAVGGLGTFSYQWYAAPATLIPGATNSIFVPNTNIVGTTNYYCIVSQPGLGCGVTSANAQVVIVPAPTITSQPQSNVLCIGGVPSPLSVSYSNGTGTASYQWYDGTGLIPGATNATFTPTLIATTSYYCIIIFSSGGCTSITSNTAVITVEPLPTIAIQPLGSQNICVGGAIPPLTVSYVNGVGTPTYQWYSNSSNATSGGTPVGTNSPNFTPPVFNTVGTFYYYVTVSLSGNGCGTVTSNPSEVIVVADPTLNTQPFVTQTLCQGTTPTSLTVNASGGLGAFGYQWYSNSPPNTLLPGETNDTYVPDTSVPGTTTYYCVISQAGIDCEVVSNLGEVIIVPAPFINTQPQNRSVCEGETVSPINVAYSNGTGVASYQWFSNSTNSNSGGAIIVGATTDSYNPSSATVGTVYYYCEITFSSGGCSLITSNAAEVNVFQIPVIIAQNVVTCSGDLLNFVPQAGGGNTVPVNTLYTWNLVGINPIGSVTGATSETVPQSGLIQTLVNSTNQVATVTYVVTPIAVICTGNSFTVDVLVYPIPAVVFDIADQIICNETNSSLVTLSSSTPGAITFNWTASVPLGIAGAILAGTDVIPVQTLVNSTTSPLTVIYTAVGTFNFNGFGCDGPASSYSITVNPTIIATGTTSNYNGYGISFFGGTDGFIDLTVTGGSGSYTYLWTGPNGFTATTEDLNGIAAGTYSVIIDDGVCAPTILTFTLTQPPELLFQEDISLHFNLLCFGDSNGVLGITITQESVPPYDFQLINSSGIVVSTILNDFGLNQVFTGLMADTYSVKIIDANGGVKTLGGIIITQPDDIVITAATTPITCYGANDASITLTVSGGTAPYSAQWDNLGTGLFQDNLSAATYTILVTDSNNCTKPITVVIPEALLFTVNPIVRNVSCFGANDGSINLNFVGGIPAITLSWSDGSTAGTTRNNLGPGTYSVTIIDGTPCTISRTFTIVEPQPLVVAANLTNAFDCDDANSGAINLLVSGGTPPFAYTWSNGTTTEDLNAVSAGNYFVTVTDVNGCVQTAQYVISRQLPINITMTTQTDFDCETRYVYESFVAQVTGGIPPYQLQWSSGTISGVNNEIMHSDTNGTVLLTVTDSYGCITTYTVVVATPVLGYSSFDTNSIGYTTYGIYSIGDPIQFQSNVTGDYVSISWDFGDGTFSTELNPVHTYNIAKDYIIKQTVTYPFGCIYVQTISLIVEKGYVLVVPTAFTPNSDGLNDTFRPVTKALKNVQLDIYDTWGSLIYSEKGDVLRGWDAKIGGRSAENGNYYSKVTAETFYGTIVNSNQTFVLIK